MSDEVFLPSYAKIPTSPDHEPNISPRGVMTVDDPYKMGRQLMKWASRLAKPQKSSKTHGKPSKTKHGRIHKKDGPKWY